MSGKLTSGLDILFLVKWQIKNNRDFEPVFVRFLKNGHMTLFDVLKMIIQCHSRLKAILFSKSSYTISLGIYKFL